MAKFKLTRKQKGDKFVYTVTDERNNVISTRTSKRDYVACTANGDFYFGRLDLIGKGDHGKGISFCRSVMENPGRESEKYIEYIKERFSDLNTIVYLSK
ncbi:hypothetical protein [Ruminococcus intestinalis]|uniref:hypothetical protein n=1 Tax=Ruminococcus intestinalis TaxID=2763066 RepID=UPI003F7FA5A9